jgi:hypothetical protein
MNKEKKPAAVAMALKRAESLTAKRRKEIAVNAVNARWAKVREAEAASKKGRKKT